MLSARTLLRVTHGGAHKQKEEVGVASLPRERFLQGAREAAVIPQTSSISVRRQSRDISAAGMTLHHRPLGLRHIYFLRAGGS